MNERMEKSIHEWTDVIQYVTDKEYGHLFRFDEESVVMAGQMFLFVAFCHAFHKDDAFERAMMDMGGAMRFMYETLGIDVYEYIDDNTCNA